LRVWSSPDIEEEVDMKIKTLAALPLIAALAASPVMAGTLGGSTQDPDVIAGIVPPPPPPPLFGGLGAGGAVAAGVAVAAVLAVALGSSDDSTE